MEASTYLLILVVVIIVGIFTYCARLEYQDLTMIADFHNNKFWPKVKVIVIITITYILAIWFITYIIAIDNGSECIY